MRAPQARSVDKSVGDWDIDPRVNVDTVRGSSRDNVIADATVTVVLIGRCTWQRKHVDWQFGSSLRNTKRNASYGLIGIVLPMTRTLAGRSFGRRWSRLRRRTTWASRVRLQSE